MKIPQLSSYLVVRAVSDPSRCRPWPHRTIHLVAQSSQSSRQDAPTFALILAGLCAQPKSEPPQCQSECSDQDVSALVSDPIELSPGSCVGSCPSFPEKLSVPFPYHVVVLPHPILGQGINVSEPHFSIGQMG